MSILNNLQNMGIGATTPGTDGASNFSSNILGMKNAIKNFVEAKKGAENGVDKKKHGVIKNFLSKKKK